MDEMTIRSRFIKGIISRYICRMLKKRFDVDVKLQLGDMDIRFDGNEIVFGGSMSGRLSREDLEKITKGAED